jgi:predicted MFS family arabinose efflux permease
MRRDLAILREPRYARLFAARTISVLGSAFGPVALAFGVLGLPGAGPTTLALVLASIGVAQVAFFLLGGVIADRLPRYRVMVTADVLAAASWAAAAAMIGTGRAPLALLMTVGAVSGLAIALFFPALTGLVPAVVTPDRLQSANGLLRLGTNIARIGGLAAAGIAVDRFGAGWALGLNALSFAVSALLLSGLRLPPTMVGTGANMLADLRAGWREFVSREWLWVIVVQAAFINAAFQAGFGVFGPVLAARELGGARAWSLILAANAVGTVVGVVFAIRLRFRRPVLVYAVTSIFFALPVGLLGLGAPAVVVAIGALVVGIMSDIGSVQWETTVQREIPDAVLSRVSSYDWLVSMVLGPLGVAVAGPVASAYGPRTGLLLSAGVCAVAAIGGLFSPQVRRLRAPEPAAILPATSAAG